ncbi:hypothetical protein [Poseidonibacter antarcticus]|uniref:hypothetical protein n=1 Tax=Poseidonibacter antarcticus TaxID=2478538 RepID=UPI000EF52FCD|nr:hypothetical protein [Poseidonibacter antarcticus]
MKKSIVLSSLLFVSSIFATDLNVEFTNNKWDGITVPKDEVCSNYNVQAGSTPALKVSNIPQNTTKLIFTYSDKTFTKMDNGGHGVIAFNLKENTKDVKVPAQQGETFKLKEGFEVVTAHTGTRFKKTPGAYLAPCSGGKGNTYIVYINAVDSSNKSLAKTELVLGKF